jgi:chromosome segregation ATPase
MQIASPTNKKKNMTAAPLHVGCTGSTNIHDDDPVSAIRALQARMRELETDLRAKALQAECDAANIKLQAQRIAALEATLETEQARGEKHAEALMQIARTCDDRARELQAQHTEKLEKVESAHATRIADKEAMIRDLKSAHGAIVASKDVVIAAGQTALIELKASHTAATARSDATIADLNAALAALKTENVRLSKQTTGGFGMGTAAQAKDIKTAAAAALVGSAATRPSAGASGAAAPLAAPAAAVPSASRPVVADAAVAARPSAPASCVATPAAAARAFDAAAFFVDFPPAIPIPPPSELMACFKARLEQNKPRPPKKFPSFRADWDQ